MRHGLTETSPATHLSPPDDRNRPGSVGFLVSGTECKVVDPATGGELGPGKDGELWMRGPQVMKGYLNQPAATAQVIDADGFFHSGDIGHVDDEGYFYIVDRLKELIKYKGMQVAPAELEALLLTATNAIRASSVTSPRRTTKALGISPDSVIRHGNHRGIGHRRMRSDSEVPSGKILRRILVERDRQKKASSSIET
ncbi:MAG: AMP-binding protein [Vicinamibacteria bacterium]